MYDGVVWAEIDTGTGLRRTVCASMEITSFGSKCKHL